jgi:peptide/nickel transport system permease protein
MEACGVAVTSPVTRAIETAEERAYRPVLRRLWRNKAAMVGLVVIGVMAVAALLAPLIAPYDPTAQNPLLQLQHPGLAHLMGTDEFGRDVFSRIIYGTRPSLAVGFIAVGIATIAGLAVGVTAGYCGRWVDNVLMRVMDVIFAFPDVLLAIAIVAMLGSSLPNVMIAIGVVYTPIFARISRSAVLGITTMPFMEAAQAAGTPHLKIIARHVLPNIVAPVIVQISVSFAFAILTEAALSFLGLGIQPPAPSWGLMLSSGRQFIYTDPLLCLWPGIAIVLAVLAFNFVGDGLRDALDPRLER